MTASVLHSYFAGHALFTRKFELSHQLVAVGGPGWLGISRLDQEYMYMFWVISAIVHRDYANLW